MQDSRLEASSLWGSRAMERSLEGGCGGDEIEGGLMAKARCSLETRAVRGMTEGGARDDRARAHES